MGTIQCSNRSLNDFTECWIFFSVILYEITNFYRLRYVTNHLFTLLPMRFRNRLHYVSNQIFTFLSSVYVTICVTFASIYLRFTHAFTLPFVTIYLRFYRCVYVTVCQHLNQNSRKLIQHKNSIKHLD